jgi:protein-L-isoaspartate(D-aspartate) O-methyltransferase
LSPEADSAAARKKREQLLAELRHDGITDSRVLDALEHTPRELFVPDAFRDKAYDNVALPIGHGQTISQPYIVALMTQALEAGERDKVLEIGTGSGYQAAVLARLCRRVLTIERHRALLKEAEARFTKLRLHNVTGRFGDGTKGWPEHETFDRIIVTAAASHIPDNLLAHLTEGGILVAPIGEHAKDQKLYRLRRRDGDYQVEEMCRVRFVPLVAGLPREGGGREGGGRESGAREVLSRPGKRD